MERRQSPLIFGHRGGDDGSRPNSAQAIRRAATSGADGVEIDVQLSADGRLVAEHDPLAQGADFDGDELSNILTAIDETGLKLLVDFKSTGRPDDEAAALATALGATSPQAVTVSSFTVPFLRSFEAIAPQFDLVPIVSLRQNFPRVPDLGRWSGVSVLAVALLLQPQLIWRVRRGDLRLFVWFGATEWPFLAAAITRLGAHALIVKRTRRYVRPPR